MEYWIYDVEKDQYLNYISRTDILMNYIVRIWADIKDPTLAWVIQAYNYEVNILKIDLLKGTQT